MNRALGHLCAHIGKRENIVQLESLKLLVVSVYRHLFQIKYAKIM